MQSLYLVRHGETDFNKARIVQGRGVDTVINATGQEQAAAFHRAYSHVPFDAVITSTLQRTHQSVAPFIDSGLPWHQFAELDEIDWGIYEGKASTPESRAAYKQVVDAWAAGSYHERLPEGESAFEMYSRQQSFVQQLPTISGETLLICSHGRAMRSLLCLLLQKPLSAMEEFVHSNLTLYQLAYNGDSYQLIKANDSSHLQDSALSS